MSGQSDEVWRCEVARLGRSLVEISNCGMADGARTLLRRDQRTLLAMSCQLIPEIVIALRGATSDSWFAMRRQMAQIVLAFDVVTVLSDELDAHAPPDAQSSEGQLFRKAKSELQKAANQFLRWLDDETRAALRSSARTRYGGPCTGMLAMRSSDWFLPDDLRHDSFVRSLYAAEQAEKSNG